MSRRRLLVGLAALTAIAVAWSFWGSDRRQIERRIERLERLVSKSDPETTLQGLARAREITGLFAPAFDIRARQLGFATGDAHELIRFVHGYRSRWDSIDMRVSSESIDIVPEHRRATQIASLDFRSGGPLASGSELYRVQINWLREDGDWRIDYVDLIEIAPR